MKELDIVGNGFFSREVERLIERINAFSMDCELLGFIDEDTTYYKVLGNYDYILNYQEEHYISIAIKASGIYEKICKNYKYNLNIKIVNFIDSNVMHSGRTCFGEGNIVCDNIIIVDIWIETISEC